MRVYDTSWILVSLGDGLYQEQSLRSDVPLLRNSSAMGGWIFFKFSGYTTAAGVSPSAPKTQKCHCHIYPLTFHRSGPDYWMNLVPATGRPESPATSTPAVLGKKEEN